MKEKKQNPLPRNGKRQIPASEMPLIKIHTADPGPEGFAVMHSREEMKKIMDQF